jgi:hypothetical protein
MQSTGMHWSCSWAKRRGAAGSDPALRALLYGSQDRHELFLAFVDLLARRPSVAVLEDVHWADDATLDLLRYAGRRIARTHSLLVASYRSDEVIPAYPLRGVLGDLATTGAVRMAVQPLSLAAVRSLAKGQGVDAIDLHGKTGGNPFFVTEALAASGSGVPATVQDAVLARAARLSRSARAVLDAAAVAGPRVEPWLLQMLTAAEAESIDECLATGVLRADDASFSFRHELARQAVLQAMTPTRAMSLHRMTMQALPAMDGWRADPARLALHAGGAGDRDGVLRWTPEAARAAAARGAHRQAARHWEQALEHAGGGTERAALLDAYAVEVHMSVGVQQAIAARSEAARRWCAQASPGNAAMSLARQSLLSMYSSQLDEGELAVREARALVAFDADPSAALVVHGCAAWLRMLGRDYEEAIALALPVLAEAERSGDAAETAASLKTIGASLLFSGKVDEGIAHLERGLAVGERGSPGGPGVRQPGVRLHRRPAAGPGRGFSAPGSGVLRRTRPRCPALVPDRLAGPSGAAARSLGRRRARLPRSLARSSGDGDQPHCRTHRSGEAHGTTRRSRGRGDARRSGWPGHPHRQPHRA